MNYLDRLIQRARAVPRGDRAQLHDPFEQVADWLLDPPKARQPDIPPSAEPPRPLPAPNAAEMPAIVPKPIDAPPPPAAALPRPEPAHADTPPTLVPEEPPAPPSRSHPLEIADAFMRSLAPAPIELPAGHPAETILPPEPPVVRPERPAAPPGEPALMTPQQPIEPARPTPTPEPSPPAARAEASSAPQRTPPPARPVIPGRRLIVQHSGDDRLADLAQGSNIVRFGIRQG
jgi:hypothetical protein